MLNHSLGQRIGVESFSGTSVVEISIPESVRELSERCFFKCETLRYVTFGSSSSLEIVGAESFCGTMISDIFIPDGVLLLSERCFYRCESLSRVVFRTSSLLESIGVECFSMTSIRDLFIPDRVRDLCDRCFYECKSLSHIRFGRFSSLERVGVEAFAGIVDGCPIHKIYIPDNVKELCNRCFACCRYLSCIRFGACSSLASIGIDSFSGTPVMAKLLYARENPRELRYRCFWQAQ